jgi:hypothetical protein
MTIFYTYMTELINGLLYFVFFQVAEVEEIGIEPWRHKLPHS